MTYDDSLLLSLSFSLSCVFFFFLCVSVVTMEFRLEAHIREECRKVVYRTCEHCGIQEKYIVTIDMSLTSVRIKV